MRREEKQVREKCRIRPQEKTMRVQCTERDCGTDEPANAINPMANQAMDCVLNVIESMPKGKGERADEQYGDQCSDERMFGVEVHFRFL